MKKFVLKSIFLLGISLSSYAQETVSVTENFDSNTHQNNYQGVFLNDDTSTQWKSVVIPTGWGPSHKGWSSYYKSDTFNAHTGDYCARLAVSHAYMIYPIELESGINTVNFSCYIKGEDADELDSVNVRIINGNQVSNINNGALHLYETEDEISGDWQKIEINNKEITVPTAGTYYLAIGSNMNGGGRRMYVDTINFNITPSDNSNFCSPLSNIEAQVLSQNSIKITWNHTNPTPEGGYQYYYSSQEIAPNNNTTPIGTTQENNVILSNLQADTAYHIWVRAVCNATQSEWKKANIVSTPCGIQSVPYTVGFEEAEGYDYLLDESKCWEQQKLPNSHSKWNIYFYSGYQNTRTAKLSWNSNAWLYKKFYLAQGTYKFSVMLRNNQHETEIEARYGESIEQELVNFILPAENLPATGNTYVKKEMIFTIPANGEYYIGFRGKTQNNTNALLYLDNYSLEAVQPCDIPATITLNPATCQSTSVSGTFTHTNNVTYSISPNTPGITIGNGTIEGLAFNTYYTFKAENTNCSNTYIFNTGVQPTKPEAPTAEDQTFCEGAKVGNLIAEGINIKWYNSATSSTPLPSNTVLVNGMNYFAAQSNEYCESDRKQITVTIIAKPQTPTGEALQTLPMGATLQNIVTNPQNLSWFATENDAKNNINPLPANTSLEDNKSYFGVAISGECVSNPIKVTIKIALSTNNFETKEISYYPNPVENNLYIHSQTTMDSIEIYTIAGQRIKSIKVKDNNAVIDMSHLNSGWYIIKVVETDKDYTIKVVKR